MVLDRTLAAGRLDSPRAHPVSYRRRRCSSQEWGEGRDAATCAPGHFFGRADAGANARPDAQGLRQVTADVR
jgi:hypothetical protein